MTCYELRKLFCCTPSLDFESEVRAMILVQPHMADSSLERYPHFRGFFQ